MRMFIYYVFIHAFMMVVNADVNSNKEIFPLPNFLLNLLIYQFSDHVYYTFSRL
jgi:hypothetical protein